MEVPRQLPAIAGVCLPHPGCVDLAVPLALVVGFIVVLVLLGADPGLALGSFVAIAGAATRMVRS